jgi:hypothetical protein
MSRLRIALRDGIHDGIQGRITTPRGRKPVGDRALTGAQRQARYRAARAGQPGIRYPHATRLRAKGAQRTDRRSRPQRWRDAIPELLAVQAECAAWLDKPEATQGSPTGEALQAIVDLDLDELCAIEPPRGFGRD